MSITPDTFLDTVITEANSTVIPAVPEGDWPAYIFEIKPRTIKNGSMVLDVLWIITAQEVIDELGMDEPRVRQSVWLDQTETGSLDFSEGKNVGLGRLRAAVNQNQSGKPWSPNQLLGQNALVTVKQRVVDEDTYADVKAVHALED